MPKGIARLLARMISRRQCNAVDAIVAPSQPMLDVLRKYGVKTQAEVIPTGLQANSFTRADGGAFRAEYGIALDRPVLLYVGRVAFEKNIDFLLRMAYELRKRQPDILLVIAGEGPAEESMRALCEDLGMQDNTLFIGYLDRHKELNACYKSADVFVFSSKSETQGLVLLEAMAQGVPVVAIAELGTKSILIEGQGAMIAPDDESIFADKVLSLLNDRNRLSTLGKSAQEYARERWTSAAQAERMAHFYQGVITSHSQP
jgi:glycosyltransferase involved in cell wall biosynthesis